MIRMPTHTPAEVIDRIIDCINNLRLILKKYNAMISYSIDSLTRLYNVNDCDGWYIRDIHQRSLQDIFCRIFELQCYIDMYEYAKDISTVVNELWMLFKGYSSINNPTSFISKLDIWYNNTRNVNNNQQCILD